MAMAVLFIEHYLLQPELINVLYNRITKNSDNTKKNKTVIHHNMQQKHRTRIKNGVKLGKGWSF